MAKIVWCNLCNRNVTPEKKFNWLAFIFLCQIPYLLYYWLFKNPVCPICHGNNFSQLKLKKEDTITERPINPQSHPPIQESYGPKFGNNNPNVNSGEKFPSSKELNPVYGIMGRFKVGKSQKRIKIKSSKKTGK